MQMTDRGAEEVAKTLMHQFPSLVNQSPEVMKMLFGQIVARVKQADVGLVKNMLDPQTGVAAKLEHLTLYNLNKWIDEVEAKQRRINQLSRDKPKAIGDLNATSCKPGSPERAEWCAKFEIMAESRRGNHWPSVEPYSDPWLEWFHWNADHDFGNVFMLRQAQEGKPWTVVSEYPPK